jgi:hypothetical protein
MFLAFLLLTAIMNPVRTARLFPVGIEEEEFEMELAKNVKPQLGEG